MNALPQFQKLCLESLESLESSCEPLDAATDELCEVLAGYASGADAFRVALVRAQRSLLVALADAHDQRNPAVVDRIAREGATTLEQLLAQLAAALEGSEEPRTMLLLDFFLHDTQVSSPRPRACARVSALIHTHAHAGTHTHTHTHVHDLFLHGTPYSAPPMGKLECMCICTCICR